MFKQFIHTLSGSEIYLAVSLLIFVVFFIGMAIWLIFVDKKYIHHMQNLPVEANKTDTTSSDTSNLTPIL